MKKAFLSLLMAGAMVFAFNSCEPKSNGTDDPDGPDGPSNFDASKFACLQGSDYYLIALDDVAAAAINSKITANLRVDDTNTFLYVWENTYSAGTPTGPNFFGLVEGWPCLTVGSVGWSGCGICSYSKTELDKLPAITAAPDEYTFHVALKSQDPSVHDFVMYPATGEAKIQIGVPNGGYKYSFPRDGEWHEIEIPMTEFTNQGLLWDTTQWATADPVNLQGGFNIIAILNGAYGELNLDACFIYKKAK